MESLASLVIFKYPLIIVEILLYFFIVYKAVKELICSHRGIRHPNATNTGDIVTQEHLDDHVTMITLLLVSLHLFIGSSVIAVLNIATMTIMTEHHAGELVFVFLGSQWYFYMVVTITVTLYLIIHHLKTERTDCYLDEFYIKQQKVLDTNAYYKSSEPVDA